MLGQLELSKVNERWMNGSSIPRGPISIGINLSATVRKSTILAEKAVFRFECWLRPSRDEIDVGSLLLETITVFAARCVGSAKQHERIKESPLRRGGVLAEIVVRPTTQVSECTWFVAAGSGLKELGGAPRYE